MKPLTPFCELRWTALLMRSFFQERPSLNTWRHSLELADAVTWTKAIKASGKWNLAFGMLESLEKKRIQKDAGTQLSLVFFTGYVLVLYLFYWKNPWPNVHCCHFFVTCFIFEFWEGCGSLQYSDHLLWEKLPMVSWALSIGNTSRVPWSESQEPIYNNLNCRWVTVSQTIVAFCLIDKIGPQKWA